MLTRPFYSNLKFSYSESSESNKQSESDAALSHVKKIAKEHHDFYKKKLDMHEAKAKAFKEFVDFLKKLSHSKYKIGGEVYDGLIRGIKISTTPKTYTDEHKITVDFKYNYDSKTQNTAQKNKVSEYARSEINNKFKSLGLNNFSKIIDHGGLSYRGIQVQFEF